MADEVASRRIHLVRHGETVGDSGRRFHGRNDVALAELGCEQMRRAGAALAAMLAPTPVAALVHSSLSRARTSAEIIAGALRPPPRVVESESDFAEVWFGSLEGLTEEEIAAAHPDWHRQWRAGQVDRYPGGETLAGFVARVTAGFRSMRARHPRGDLLVVAHKGTIKAMLAHALALDWPEVRKWPLELGSITVVEERQAATEPFRLLDYNRVP